MGAISTNYDLSLSSMTKFHFPINSWKLEGIFVDGDSLVDVVYFLARLDEIIIMIIGLLYLNSGRYLEILVKSL